MTLARFDEKQHRYYIGDRLIVGITQALSLSGLAPKPEMNPRFAANFKYAGERGKAIHKMCELDDLDRSHLYDYDENLAGYLSAWQAFKREWGFKPDFVEEFLIHEIYCFGGIPDCAGYCDRLNAYTVVERKSRELADYDQFQVAGQRILLEDVEKRKVGAEVLVQLKADGTFLPRILKDRKARGIFLAAVTISNTILSS